MRSFPSRPEVVTELQASPIPGVQRVAQIWEDGRTAREEAYGEMTGVRNVFRRFASRVAMSTFDTIALGAAQDAKADARLLQGNTPQVDNDTYIEG